MKCGTCPYKTECASSDVIEVMPESVVCGIKAEVIDIDDYRRAKGLHETDESMKLFGIIDTVFEKAWPWIIWGGVVYIMYHLLRWWLT